MRINVRIDDAKMILKLRKGEKRLAYTVANALNETAKSVQRVQRRQVRRRFTVRKRQFIERQIAIIKPFASASQGRAFVVISVGQKKRLLLPIYEEGGLRPPTKGKRSAIPIPGTPARPSFREEVPEQYFFSKLRLRRPRARKRKKTRAGASRRGPRPWQGLQGTYMIPGTGVFKRLRDSSQLIYLFKRNQRLGRKLGWIETARRVIERQFPKIWEREKEKTLRRHLNR